MHDKAGRKLLSVGKTTRHFATEHGRTDMTDKTTTTPLTLNPQIIGQAENAHLPILNHALAGSGLTKDAWVTLSPP